MLLNKISIPGLFSLRSWAFFLMCLELKTWIILLSMGLGWGGGRFFIRIYIPPVRRRGNLARNGLNSDGCMVVYTGWLG